MGLLKKLLSLFRPKPVTSIPDSKWPDILDPFQYQDKLMKQHERSNMEAYQAMMEAVAGGAKLTLQSWFEGPYLTYKTYTFDNGYTFSVTLRSSLKWVEPMMKI